MEATLSSRFNESVKLDETKTCYRLAVLLSGFKRHSFDTYIGNVASGLEE